MKRSKLKEAAHKVIRKVNRVAYVFKPDVLLTVGIDFKHGRIVVAQEKSKLTIMELVRLDACKMQIETAARAYCTAERLRRGLHVEPCKHPFFRIKKKAYVHHATRRGTEIKEKAWFCTKCGVKIKEVDETKLTTLGEVVQAKRQARNPKIHKMKVLL